MARVTTNAGNVLVTLTPQEKLWSIHRDFILRQNSVKSVTTTQPDSSWKELRAPGTFIPRVIKAGTYFSKRGKEFWYVTKSKPHVLVIELSNNSYARLVLGFESRSYRDSTQAKLSELIRS